MKRDDFLGRKVIVAGCGHGGLVAASTLSQNGFDVTVFEKEEKINTGHDQLDCMRRETVIDAELPENSLNIKDFDDISYYSPDRTVLIKTHKKSVKNLCCIERKELINALISSAEEKGVKTVFGAKIKTAVTDGDFVKGITYEKDGEEHTEYCDLVIDSAGLFSPVRKSLPKSFGIENEISEDDILFVYRAYFDKKNLPSALPKYTVYFYHKGNKGLDWVINDDSQIDVLVGSFGPLNKSTVTASINDFKRLYPCFGNNLIKGGFLNKIPLRRPLPVFTCNGYAAVGDSACMTEPLSGSGITLSVKAGKMLAQNILSSGDNFNLKENLYIYQRNYLKKYMKRHLNDDTVKHLLIDLGEKNLNELFRKKVLGEKEFGGGDRTATDILIKIKGVLTTPSSVPALLKAAKRLAKVKMAVDNIPYEYNENAVKVWADLYNTF